MSRPRCTGRCSGPGEACAFRVAWSINPHMRVGSVDVARATAQHADLASALASAGARVVAVPFVHGAFDSVFIKDNAVVVERASGGLEALLAAPKHDERRQEQAARARAMGALDIALASTPAEPLEGGDIVVVPGGNAAFMGYGFRSSHRAADDLARFLGGDVTALELRDPRLYHLDMALSVLDDGTALVCEEAFTDGSRQQLARHAAIREIVRVPVAEALRFGVNLVQVGRTIVWGADAPSTRAELRRRGYSVEQVSLGQFHLAGGSAACLVSRIHRQQPVDRSVAA